MFKTVNIKALLLIYVLLFYLFSCTPPISPTPPLSESEVNYNKAIEEFKQIELIDTVNEDFKTCAISELSTAYYLPLHIGLTPKCIDLSERSYLELDSFYDFDDHTIRVKPAEFIIYVDTSRLIGMQNRLSTPPPPPPPGSSNSVFESYRRKFKTSLYNAYPVFLKNNSDSLRTYIGHSDFIELLLEAKDSFGVWRPIQKHYYLRCATGLRYLHLPPQNILLTACPIFIGEFKTHLRLVFLGEFIDENNEKITPFVSNEFEGYINYGQFEHSDSTYKRKNVYCE